MHPLAEKQSLVFNASCTMSAPALSAVIRSCTRQLRGGEAACAPCRRCSAFGMPSAHAPLRHLNTLMQTVQYNGWVLVEVWPRGMSSSCRRRCTGQAHDAAKRRRHRKTCSREVELGVTLDSRQAVWHPSHRRVACLSGCASPSLYLAKITFGRCIPSQILVAT